MAEPAELRTERLLLRPFREGDVDDVFAYAADDVWRRYLLNPPQTYTRQHAEELVTRYLGADWNSNPNFALVLDGRVVGHVGFVINGRVPAAELGYSLARVHWGKGLALEAARAAVDWAFPTYDLARVFARADARNERSWRLLERLGMTREGLLRQHRVAQDGRADEVAYGLLREEWEPKPGDQLSS
jgi:ribosomal-protein-alanine N-acetyltransferase